MVGPFLSLHGGGAVDILSHIDPEARAAGPTRECRKSKEKKNPSPDRKLLLIMLFCYCIIFFFFAWGENRKKRTKKIYKEPEPISEMKIIFFLSFLLQMYRTIFP